MTPITTVVFDVGETLVDETRHWGEWADWMGVPRFTFFAVYGAVIARGLHHRGVFQALSPRFDFPAALRAREATGWRYGFEPSDFYPDALPCLKTLRAAGLRVGIAGNQPEAAETSLAALGISADFIASSEGWGVEKPSPEFFARVVEAAGCAPAEIAYVGDRVDNDVGPARAAGMLAVFLRRGPWAYIQTPAGSEVDADVELASLDDLLAAITAHNARKS
jgi:FMN phosphatase YigB (HAD superfamily)